MDIYPLGSTKCCVKIMLPTTTYELPARLFEYPHPHTHSVLFTALYR